jgi:hypothetical protein
MACNFPITVSRVQTFGIADLYGNLWDLLQLK